MSEMSWRCEANVELLRVDSPRSVDVEVWPISLLTHSSLQLLRSARWMRQHLSILVAARWKKTCFLEFWPCNSVAYLELRQTVLNLFSITVSSIATCCQHKSTIIYWFSKSPRTCVNVCNARSSHISMAGGKDSLNENCMNCMILNMQREHLQLKQLLHFNITPLKIWLFANFILQAVRVLKDMIRCALQCLTVPAMESIDMETVMQRPNQDHSDPTLVAMVRIPAHLCSWKQVKAFK